MSAHGTYAGWNRHKRDGETPCLQCLEAQRQYQTEYRKNNKSYRLDGRVRDQALRLLAKAHPDEFAELRKRVRNEMGADR